MQDEFLQVRTWGVNFHVLRDSTGLYLIDGGFIGGEKALLKALKQRGWNREPVRGILVTHGHLDHILNIRQLAEKTGAWVAAPQLDADRYEAKNQNTGFAKIGGLLETVGRKLFDYRPFRVDRRLDDFSEIPIWGGLTAIQLPGHTEGHTGFYSEKNRLLFSADLFASYASFSHFPPAIFNHSPDQMSFSVRKALELNLDGVQPNHCDQASPKEHLARLRVLIGRKSGR